jgi:hypothetical protein
MTTTHDHESFSKAGLECPYCPPRAQALAIARKIRAGADPKPYQGTDGLLPDSVLDAICDLSLGQAK